MKSLKNFFIEKFGDKCEYSDKCPFYNSETCDQYYNLQLTCGIKKEIEKGDSWEKIKDNHHKTNSANKPV